MWQYPWAIIHFHGFFSLLRQLGLFGHPVLAPFRGYVH
jgi:hypothetical protein